MRSLSRVLLLGTLSAAVMAPSAMAVPSLTAKVSPTKGGTVTQATPISFTINGTFPDTPSDPSGNLQLQSIGTKLPPSLLFNTIPFATCPGNSIAKTGFFATKVCPSSTKLGTATVVADGGTAGLINVKTDLFFGDGFSVFAHVTSNAPAIIDEAVEAKLQSSGAKGYGLELYIPIPDVLKQPLQGLYPTIKSVSATVKPAVKSVKVDGKKVKVPLTGLGPCPSSKTLPFQMDIAYTDAGNVNTVKTDSAKASSKCTK